MSSLSSARNLCTILSSIPDRSSACLTASVSSRTFFPAAVAGDDEELGGCGEGASDLHGFRVAEMFLRAEGEVDIEVEQGLGGDETVLEDVNAPGGPGLRC